jgi:diguanylate cyclase (GGDEF)-like protein
MGASQVPDLARLTERPFQSFSEATAAVLDVLSARLPDCRVVVAGLNYDQGEYRIIDAAGASLDEFTPGFTLPIGEAFCMHMADNSGPRLCADAASDSVYSQIDMHRSWGVCSYIGFPLELSDGSRVGSLSAMSQVPDRFTDEELDLLSVAGRLLSYEWERVAREVELQRLRKFRGDPDTTDTLTGVTTQQSFLSWLVHEWQAAHQGTVESYLVVFELEGRDAAVERLGAPVGDLLLKDAARALHGAARRTDIVGRVANDGLGVVLVGCKGREGAQAFCNRVSIAFGSLIEERPAGVELQAEIHDLGKLRSADQALELAGQTARKMSTKVRKVITRQD